MLETLAAMSAALRSSGCTLGLTRLFFDIRQTDYSTCVAIPFKALIPIRKVRWKRNKASPFQGRDFRNRLPKTIKFVVGISCMRFSVRVSGKLLPQFGRNPSISQRRNKAVAKRMECEA